jgi:pimeloyl-ACP methyl ester carboxylesterase
MEHRFLTVDDGITLHYIAAGSGPNTIIFVHGWCSNANHFSSQLTHFSRISRVIAIDRRGHGESEVPSSGYDASRHSQDLLAILEHENVQSAVIVGHAGGCPSVLTFATQQPQLCRALVLLDTRISAHVDLEGSGKQSPLAQMITSIDDDEVFARIYRGFVSNRNPELQNTVVRDAMAVPRSVAQQDLASIAIDTVALARSVQCPVLWLTADEPDNVVLSSTFADIRFQQCTESGHFVQLEAAEEVNKSIEEFLVEIGLQLTTDSEIRELGNPR